jgi:hypothetical protein
MLTAVVGAVKRAFCAWLGVQPSWKINMGRPGNEKEAESETVGNDTCQWWGVLRNLKNGRGVAGASACEEQHESMYVCGIAYRCGGGDGIGLER